MKQLDANQRERRGGSIQTEAAAGKDVLIFGSGELVNTLMQHDLIDEYRIMLFHVLVDSGKRLSRDGSAQKALRLLETKTFGSGVVVLSYRPARSEAVV